jgi:NAD(P)-dependent dehydrogenase (short-subunit alcohol dehydrogenase family)
MRTPKRVALVTGAAKGLGLAIAEGLARKGLSVRLTARKIAAARAAAEPLARAGLDVVPLVLDVDDDASVRAAAKEAGPVDVLVNNAAVLLDDGGVVSDLEPDTLRATLETNVLGALRVTRAFLPGMRKRRWGRVVNVSSAAGSFDDMATPRAFGAWDAAAYSTSKAALNALTVLLARETKDEGILVNAACPGWVKTDMGGPHAPLSPEEGADTPVWLATLPDDGPTGGFFQRRRPHPW